MLERVLRVTLTGAACCNSTAMTEDGLVGALCVAEMVASRVSETLCVSGSDVDQAVGSKDKGEEGEEVSKMASVVADSLIQMMRLMERDDACKAERYLSSSCHVSQRVADIAADVLVVLIERQQRTAPAVVATCVQNKKIVEGKGGERHCEAFHTFLHVLQLRCPTAKAEVQKFLNRRDEASGS